MLKEMTLNEISEKFKQHRAIVKIVDIDKAVVGYATTGQDIKLEIISELIYLLETNKGYDYQSMDIITEYLQEVRDTDQFSVLQAYMDYFGWQFNVLLRR